MFHEHDHVIDYVDDYLHEVLDLPAARHVEQHCENCRICKVALEEARKRFAALETVSACEASEQLVQATMQHIDAQEQKRKRLRKRLAWSILPAAAAAALIIGAFNIYFVNLSPTPYDLQILGQTRLLAGSVASLRIRLIDRNTGAALAKVPVEIELRDPHSGQLAHLARFDTDADGTGQPRLKLPDWGDGDYELRVTAKPAGDTETVQRTIKLERSWKLMLSSDKPVYQPGQEIHVRAMTLRRPDLKPVAGHDVVFTITDPKGNIIFKRQDVTSKFGIASVDCPLATEIIEGPYTIACKVGDTESKRTVNVKKYVLPKFKVAVELDKPYYQPGQKMKGTVQADYFFGKPVAGGTVEIEFTTIDIPASQKNGEPPGLSRRATTDPSGKASFEFVLPKSLVGREQDSGDARFAVQVTVTDTAGQKQTKSESRVVTNSPIKIEVIPEGGTLVDGIPNIIYLFVSYADGRPAKKARLAVSGVEKELVTNDLGVVSLEIKPTSSTLDWTIRATDDQGITGSRQIQLACGNIGRDFLVRTDKAVYNGGGTMKLVALGGGIEPIFVDLIKDGQTVLTEIIDIRQEKGEHSVDLPPELSGTVLLCAYRYVSEGLPVRKTRVLYIRSAQQLQIQTALDRHEYRPGRQAKLQFTLTDSSGQPTPGAISLAAVDEAVFSVLDQAPGMEKTFYTLEQELLKPVYAIYPWSPDLTTSLPAEERNEFEHALFAKTSQAVSTSSVERPRNRGRIPRVENVLAANSPHSLSIDSFPQKSAELETRRESGLGWVQTGWMLFAIALGLTLYALLWVFVRPVRVLVIIHGLCFMLMCVISVGLITTLGKTSNGAFDFVTQTMPANAKAVPSEPTKPRIFREAGQADVLASGEGRDSGDAAPPRVREWFPETLLWRPELITDDHGRASLDVDLADSITTWRLTASAISADGRLGANQSSVRVFQPFFVDLNLPVALTRGDEVAVPVVVYNYLAKPQTVELALDDGKWFELLDQPAKRIELAANEVKSTSYRIRVTKVGNYTLQVTARGAGVADAIKKQIEVVPDGRRIEQVTSGTLQQPAEIALAVPQDAVEGSPKAILKIYPSSFSQLVEGLDAIFRMPYGCFEQTSSTTYPNILALDYLRRTHKNAPEVEAKARQYIHLGYQRLVSFEVQGGGFDWFGRPPANRTLTAYGLMEFEDMARVHDVDPALIERTRKWLLAQQKSDGSWDPESHGLHDDPTRSDLARLSTTAYIGWATFGSTGREREFAQAAREMTLRYLLRHAPETINDPCVLALVANALLAIEPRSEVAQPYLDRLESLKRQSGEGKFAYWEQKADSRTAFYGSGRSGSIETTALAVIAMIQASQHHGIVRGALAWLVSQKDSSGTWYSTQATVLALKALVAGTGKPLGGDQERRIEIALDDHFKREIVIPADQADVMKQLDLSESLRSGSQQLTITEKSNTGAGYQVAFRYHLPDAKPPAAKEPLSIDVLYDSTDLRVGDTVKATAIVVNQMNATAPMVILDLPIPAGFALDSDDLAKRQAASEIAKFQVTARKAIIYLRGLEPGKPLKLEYHLRATMPVKVSVPSALAYEYYDTDKRGQSAPARMTVAPRN